MVESPAKGVEFGATLANPLIPNRGVPRQVGLVRDRGEEVHNLESLLCAANGGSGVPTLSQDSGLLPLWKWAGPEGLKIGANSPTSHNPCT